MRNDKYLINAERLHSISNTARNELLKIQCESTGLNYSEVSSISNSQIGQDIFVISKLNKLRKGYFVEFGATDGISISNTWMLEKDFGWSGILVEPGRNWHDKIVQNRSCKIDFRCVSGSSHQELDFLETSSPELSTLSSFENSDENLREINATYKVKSVSLIDLLNQYKSPRIIDYLSIDTEGSEFMILKDFDFSKYRFRIISCEHNYSTNRGKIFKLLTQNGYERIWNEFTQFDDWYIHTELI